MLWTLFPPHELVYIGDGSYCARVALTELNFDPRANAKILVLTLVQGLHDGRKYGLVKTIKGIPAFSGARELSRENFGILPLNCLPEDEQSQIRS